MNYEIVGHIDAEFEITSGAVALDSIKQRYLVIEGTGPTRSVQSQHRSLDAAVRAKSKWAAPANIEVLDRESGEVVLVVL